MPALISHKAKRVFFLRNHDVLADTLGHSDFDGEDWAVGDLIVFEDGTIAWVEAFAEGGHGYSEPSQGDLREVVAQMKSYGDPRLPAASSIASWQQLFEMLRQPLPRQKGWLRSLLR
jgi:hypothetical protein